MQMELVTSKIEMVLHKFIYRSALFIVLIVGCTLKSVEQEIIEKTAHVICENIKQSTPCKKSELHLKDKEFSGKIRQALKSALPLLYKNKKDRQITRSYFSLSKYIFELQDFRI